MNRKNLIKQVKARIVKAQEEHEDIILKLQKEQNSDEDLFNKGVKLENEIDDLRIVLYTLENGLRLRPLDEVFLERYNFEVTKEELGEKI